MRELRVRRKSLENKNKTSPQLLESNITPKKFEELIKKPSVIARKPPPFASMPRKEEVEEDDAMYSDTTSEYKLPDNESKDGSKATYISRCTRAKTVVKKAKKNKYTIQQKLTDFHPVGKVLANANKKNKLPTNVVYVKRYVTIFILLSPKEIFSHPPTL